MQIMQPGDGTGRDHLEVLAESWLARMLELVGGKGADVSAPFTREEVVTALATFTRDVLAHTTIMLPAIAPQGETVSDDES